jgi:hypothetical protein
VSRESIPAADARRAVAALTAAGIEASSAPDHDDRGREWLYVTLADQTATEDDDTDPAGLMAYPEYRIAYMVDTAGEFEIVETFQAASDADANAYAEANHDGEWYVLNAAGRNINAGVDS